MEEDLLFCNGSERSMINCYNPLRAFLYFEVGRLPKYVSSIFNNTFFLCICLLIYSDNLLILITFEPEAAIFVAPKIAAAIAKRKQIHALHCG